MKPIPKSYSSRDRNTVFRVLLFYIFSTSSIYCQVANYVSNGGFEVVDSIHPNGNYNCATYWQPTDTNKYCYYLWTTSPAFSLPLAPYISTGFQYPRSGKNLVLSAFYCDPSTCGSISRGYPRNRLKQLLKPNVKYCAKYYVVNTNNSTTGIDSYGAFFGDASLDTIKLCNVPLVYLNPQVNPTIGIITDTLNWTAITGTFIANGTEKYMMLGNFRSNSATNTIVINPTYLPTLSHDLYIDDVSLIEMDLPAYAGPDKYVVAGDSVYIGRESDVEIDESCIWYKMTGPTTSITVDTIAGMWVKPVATSTYVVRQQLWCSGVKWDTVVVSLSGVGNAELLMLNAECKIWPNPADDVLNVKCNLLKDENCFVTITNALGQIVREEEIVFKESSASVKTGDMENGVYVLRLKGESKRFVVSR